MTGSNLTLAHGWMVVTCTEGEDIWMGGLEENKEGFYFDPKKCVYSIGR